MDLNKKSLKDFNKIIYRKKKENNLEKIFENDNYLIQTLKRTKRVLAENPAEELELNLYKALRIINKNITLLNDPEINVLNTENNDFKKNYTSFLKASENSNAQSFTDLIKYYLSNGYKIPNLDFNHNLFKVNPLIEENPNKMTNYFITENKKKLTHNEILVLKSLLYLNKLNTLLFCKQNQKRASTVNPLSKTQMKIKYNEEKEEIQKLKESIQIIQNLIEQMAIDEKKKTQFNYSFRNSFISTLKKLNSSKEQTSTKRNVVFKDIKTNNESISKFDISDINENNEINPKNEIKEKKTKSFRDYIESTTPKLNSKIKKITRNKGNSVLPERFSKYNHSNKNIMPILPFSLKNDKNKDRKKFSHKTKFNKNNYKEEMQLFARTQVKDKKPKFYFSSKSKNVESRNKSNNIYLNTFTNKTEFFDYTYRRLKRGNFEDINKIVRKYLSEIEQKSNEEVDQILNNYDYKNYKVKLKEMEINMHKKEIDRKIEKIYLNNFISKRISKKLEAMRKKEEQISRLNNIISTLGNH